MNPKLIDRRLFLKSAGALFAAGLSAEEADAFDRADAVFGAACQKPDGGFGCAIFSERGDILSTVDLPDRGHDIAYDPVTRRAVAFARRPRTFAVVFEPETGRAVQTIHSPEGRHFFGHGFFSPDGRLLYATENEIETSEGLIGLYDVADGYCRIGEFATGGIDPHEALLMPDGETIVVANGGIETDPVYGRQKLNIATMDPSLAFIERRSGKIIESQRLDGALHQLSIRHLAVDAARRIWFGCQFEGTPETMPPLVGHAALGGEIRLVQMDEMPLAQLTNYVGSVAADRSGRRIAVASPKGNTVLILDAASGSVIRQSAIADGCGLAADKAGFIATGGKGDILNLAAGDAAPKRQRLLWDNHILAL